MSDRPAPSAAKERAEFVPKHEIEACLNNGWDDEPAWTVVCDCTWEIWNQPTEAAAREAQRIHAELVAADRLPDPAAKGWCNVPATPSEQSSAQTRKVLTGNGPPVSAAVSPAEPPEVGHIDPASRYWIRRSWTGLWWRAINPDESLATVDTYTNHRAWTRDRLLAKLRRMNEPQDDPWEQVNTRDLFDA